MSRSPESKGCASVFWKIIGFFLILVIISMIIDWIKSIPVPILILALILIIAIVAVIIWRKRVKKKKLAAEGENADTEPVAHTETVSVIDTDTIAERRPQRPGMPAVSINVVSSNGKLGMYDYEYSDVGLYRPKGAVADMPPIGASLEFEEEPDNPYDSEAIKAVYNGETVGYMNKNKIRNQIRDWIINGYYYTAEVTRADSRLEFWIGMNRE